jgi:hypothetical protein
VQYALSQANNSGDTIRVGYKYTPVVYVETVAVTKSVTLEGGWSVVGFPHGLLWERPSPCQPSLTTLDAIGCGRVISITNGVAVTLDCFTITGGDATGLGGGPLPQNYDVGGGIYSRQANLTVANCVISDNVASTSGVAWGGGIGAYGGSVTLQNSVLANNVASSGSSGYGGGISANNNATLVADGVEIYSNTATFGGGVHVQDSSGAILMGIQVYSNTAGMGGGLYFTTSPSATLASSQIYSNTADYGGGVCLNSSNDATLIGNWVHGNEAWGLGGGLWVSSSDNANLVNNMIVENRLTSGADAAGVFLHHTMTAYFRHTTLARNGGGGGQGVFLSSGATAWMTNTIVASHTVGIYADNGCTVTLEATLWGDGAWANGTRKGGSGIINDGEIIVIGNPAFVDPDSGDYHIGPGSDAIDAGLAAGVTTDVDGDMRPIGPRFDIGADEAWRWVFLPLVLRNY